MSGSSGGNLPVLDTHQLSPIAPQWRDAALSADTQFVPWTGLQQNAFPHATAPTPLSWKGPASSWRRSSAVGDQPEPLPGNAPTCLPPQTSGLRVWRSWGERRGLCGDCSRLSALLSRVEPMRSMSGSDAWIQRLQDLTRRKRLFVSTRERTLNFVLHNVDLKLLQLKEILLNSARSPPTSPRSNQSSKKYSNLTKDQMRFEDFTRKRLRRWQMARYCIWIVSHVKI